MTRLAVVQDILHVVGGDVADAALEGLVGDH